MQHQLKRIVAVMGIGALSVNLGGCIVAAVPLLMAATVGVVAVTGFAVYKTVQTTGGGSVRIAFGSKDSKAKSPPPPLPAVASIAVWPGGVREGKFADTLQASGKIQVRPSTATTALPAGDAERYAAYSSLCGRSRAEMVFAAIDLGQTVESNLASFKRSSMIDKFTLEGFRCDAGKVTWSDSMATVIEVGSKPTPQAEIDAAAGQAWGERVLQALVHG